MPQITPERLRTMFRPRNVAFIGASNKSPFSVSAYGNLVDFDATDRVFLVNGRGVETHGQATYTSIAEVPEQVDLAYMMVPQAVTLDVLRELGAAGVKNAVILSSGYAEAGAQGQAAQAELVATAEELDMLLLGPNHLGFVNFVDRIPVCSIQVKPNQHPRVALLSQSGASSAAMYDFATMTAIDLSYMVTLGNEAMITAGHVLDFLVEDEATKAIAIFMETIRDPVEFSHAARRAIAAGKPVVVLKAGSSELSARTAMAHTGALVGDDHVIGAVLRELGVIRVDTIEDMLLTAGAAAHLGEVPRPGIAIASISGGACDILADRAEDMGAQFPELADVTVTRISEFFADYGTVQNPLDVTGAAVIDPTVFSRSITALADDPAVGIVGVLTSLPWEGNPEVYPSRNMLQAIGQGMRDASVPSIFMNQITQPTSAVTQWLADDAGIPYVSPGMVSTLRAMHHVGEWSQRRRELLEPSPPLPTFPLPDPEARHGEWSEAQARDLLADWRIPVVPAIVVTTPGEAVAAARGLGEAVAVKVISPDIMHKSDIGGVRLGVFGDASVREAFQQVTAAGMAVPGARVEGALVSPMRQQAAELLIGVVRDPSFGLTLAVALGGLLVELLNDSVVIPLPVTPQRATHLLGKMTGSKIFDGYRDTPPADRAQIGALISRVGDLALALGDDLVSLEINPLRVSGSQVEALDAVVEWRQKK
ncbi:MAG: acetate--CoA ligase family protein [Propionibacteriaceae bacterium]|nr:acetate--CoA ligase family protein [Propionibacteriaceae bacterium]